MRSKLPLFLLMFCIGEYCKAQEKTANLIIAVNDVIIQQGIASVELQRQVHGDKPETITARYLPGRLQYTLPKAWNNDTSSLTLSFFYNRLCGTEQAGKSYAIPISIASLAYPYFILRIYDMDLKKKSIFFLHKAWYQICL